MRATRAVARATLARSSRPHRAVGSPCTALCDFLLARRALSREAARASEWLAANRKKDAPEGAGRNGTMQNSKKIGSKRRGQGLTEYVIVVGLVGVVLVGTVTKFKDAVGNAYDKSANAIETKITKEIK